MDNQNDIDLQQNNIIIISNDMRIAEKKFKICFHNNLKNNKCLDCKKIFSSFETMLIERNNLMIDYC